MESRTKPRRRTETAATVSRAEFQAVLSELRAVQQRLLELEKRPHANEGPNEETAVVIAAAVATYLGKRATIQFIRKVGDADPWRLQGCAALQASHSMPRPRALHH